jgi:osmoprotectant transport system substrate-binding protein
MSTRAPRGTYRTASLIVVTAVCAGCMTGTSRGPPSGPDPAGRHAAGPPECPGRAYCLPGLRQRYGLHFKSFIPLDAGGPLTLQALEAGDIDVALLFSTDPSISARHLVVLADDRRLQPAENITPLVSRDVVARYGAGLMAVLNTVSARLDSASLRALNAQAENAGRTCRRVAERWLRAQGLLGKERADR